MPEFELASLEAGHAWYAMDLSCPRRTLTCSSTPPNSERILNQGVAEVSERRDEKFDRILRYELETFICEGQYRKGLDRIFSRYLSALASRAAEQKGVWISGFYGSGKTHLAKMLRVLWTDYTFRDGHRPGYRESSRRVEPASQGTGRGFGAQWCGAVRGLRQDGWRWYCFCISDCVGHHLPGCRISGPVCPDQVPALAEGRRQARNCAGTGQKGREGPVRRAGEHVCVTFACRRGPCRLPGCPSG